MIVEYRHPKGNEIALAIRCLLPNKLVVKDREDGVTTHRLRDEVIDWLDDNIVGTCGFHYIPAGFRYDNMEHIPVPEIMPEDDPVNAIWFTDETSALHFKLRWSL